MVLKKSIYMFWKLIFFFCHLYFQVSCVSVVCQYNEDCADHEACDRLNRVCRPVCEEDTCAETATCTAREHQPSCVCPPGSEGNPYIQCTSELNSLKDM